MVLNLCGMAWQICGPGVRFESRSWPSWGDAPQRGRVKRPGPCTVSRFTQSPRAFALTQAILTTRRHFNSICAPLTTANLRPQRVLGEPVPEADWTLCLPKLCDKFANPPPKMEEAPPSYRDVTQADVWQFIGPYLHTTDLVSTAAVCRQWHTAFAPHLWGDPASHFHLNDSGIPAGWTKFRATLGLARLEVRCMTHTLRIPDTVVDFHDGPEPGWLRLVLQFLPNLQSLIIRAVPFVDHAALQALGDRVTSGDTDHVSSYTSVSDAPVSVTSRLHTVAPHTFNIPVGLRLLDICHCSNVTAHGLEIILAKLVNLMYLDLSSTRAARDHRVLVSFRKLTALRVLKLRNIGLRDADIELMSSILLYRAKSLDIRDNRITDQGLDSLAQHCFAPILQSHDDFSSLGATILAIYNGEQLESCLYKTFTSKFVAQLVIESIHPSGLTHLYLSGNPMTTKGVSGIIKTGRLHVLDIGSMEISGMRDSAQHDDRNHSSLVNVDRCSFVSTLAKHAAQSLTFLRISYEVVGIGSSAQDSKITRSEGTQPSPSTVGDKSNLQVATADMTPDESGLTPDMLPYLTTLILTDVPEFAFGSQIADRLIRYVQACARASSLAWDQANLDYALPPGRMRDLDDLRYAAYSKFALKRLVLEVRTNVLNSSRSSQAQRTGTIKSMTQDPDGEALWAASAADFSFFKDDPAAGSLPDVRVQKTDHSTVQADSSQAFGANIEQKQGLEIERTIVDNIALLSTFRDERKLAHQKRSDANPAAAIVQTEGFWQGIIQVIRE